MTKVLNLYSGVGGNRKLWRDVEVTAVEMNPEIAQIYRDFFPGDTVIVADAHDYLLKHFSDFDFIWSSPPCPTHSKARRYLGVTSGQVKPVYADMKLYQEIILLQSFFLGKWVVENVEPYYTPLIQPTCKLQRHPFWANFYIPSKQFPRDQIETATVSEFENKFGIYLGKYQISNKRKILKNCVHPEIGLHVLEAAHLTTHALDQPTAEGKQAQLLNLETLSEVAQMNTAGK